MNGAASPGRENAALPLPRSVLKGRYLTLEPLSAGLRSSVGEAFALDEQSWRLLVHSGGRDAFGSWWERTTAAIAEGRSIIFAVRRLQDDCVVGTSGYLAFDSEHLRVEIGSTYFRPDARGGPVNPESKLLLMDGAFAAGAHRVEFLTDARNARSRAALRKLGATEEGVLRRHKRTWTGTVRDSVIFSVTDLEWPDLRGRLVERLSAIVA